METTVILIHALSASVVLLLGPVNILRRRRDRAHRMIGRSWSGAMLITCTSSFAIHPDGFSWLHGLAAFTLLTLTLGVLAAIRRDIATHRRMMIGSYLGTLIAFIFAAALPNRAIQRLAVTSPETLLMLITLVVATSAALVAGLLAYARPR